MPCGRVPSSRTGPATNSCSTTGMTSSAICPPTAGIGTDRQSEVDVVPEELVRDLDQDAGAVTDGGVRAGRAAVVQVDQCGDAVADDRVTASALDVRHRGNTAGVVLVLRVVQPLGGGCCRELHGRPPVVGRATASEGVGAAEWLEAVAGIS